MHTSLLGPNKLRKRVLEHSISSSMSAILMEHYGGKWPFWLSPRQVLIVPVSNKFNDYAKWAERQFMLHGFYADADLGTKTLKNKIRAGITAHYNYIAVVGDKELQDLSVNVRQGDAELGVFTMPDFMKKLVAESTPSSQPLGQFEPFEGRSPAVAIPAAPAV